MLHNYHPLQQMTRPGSSAFFVFLRGSPFQRTAQLWNESLGGATIHARMFGQLVKIEENGDKVDSGDFSPFPRISWKSKSNHSFKKYWWYTDRQEEADRTNPVTDSSWSWLMSLPFLLRCFKCGDSKFIVVFFVNVSLDLIYITDVHFGLSL